MTGEVSTAAGSRPIRLPDRAELPPLRPRTAFAVIDEAITFLRVEPLLMLGATVVVLLPLRLIAAAVPGSPLRGARPDDLADIFFANLSAPGAVGAALAAIVLDSIALFTVAALFGQLIASWHAGAPPTLTSLLMDSIRRSPAIVVSWTLVHLIVVGVGLVTTGIGALLLGPLFLVTAPAMGAERVGPLRAMGRSRSLVGGRMFHAFVIWSVSGIFALVIAACVEALPSVIGLEAFNAPLWLVAGVADFVGAVVSTAFVAAVAVVAYTDLRVRAEGIDLYVALEEEFG